MAKDSGGHGSTNGWGHAEHWAEAQKLMKERVGHLNAGRKKEAADTMARVHEHAEQAKHMLVSERRQSAGVTPKQKMEAAAKPGAAKSFWNNYGKKPRNT